MSLQLVAKCISSLPLSVLIRHIDAKLLHLLGKLLLVVAEGALEVVGPSHEGHPLHARPVSKILSKFFLSKNETFTCEPTHRSRESTALSFQPPFKILMKRIIFIMSSLEFNGHLLQRFKTDAAFSLF